MKNFHQHQCPKCKGYAVERYLHNTGSKCGLTNISRDCRIAHWHYHCSCGRDWVEPLKGEHDGGF